MEFEELEAEKMGNNDITHDETRMAIMDFVRSTKFTRLSQAITIYFLLLYFAIIVLTDYAKNLGSGALEAIEFVFLISTIVYFSLLHIDHYLQLRAFRRFYLFNKIVMVDLFLMYVSLALSLLMYFSLKKTREDHMIHKVQK